MNDDAKQAATTRTAAEQISARALGSAVKANNEFGTALFAALRAESAGQNFLTSPISASLALGMTYAGASGETRAQMGRALHLPPSTDDDPSLFEGQNALSQLLAQRGASAFEMDQASRGKYGPPLNASDYSLRLVNSLWGEASYPWERSFTKALAVNYGAELCQRDFKHRSQPTRLEINRWVSAHTNERINDLLPEPAVAANTRLVLVNALHLKLPWEKEFFEVATQALPFTRSDRKQVTAPFMHRQERLAYRDDGSAQIVGIPLTSRRLWVIIALPHVGVPLSDYERSLRADSAALSVPLQSELVALALPKVTFTSPSFSLAGALQRMGMVHAFDPNRAQFEGMCQVQPGEVPLYIGDILQKTMIAIQENGIEAAAATAVVAIAGCAVLPREQPVPIPMIVNRPYLLAIVDQPTGALLMLGHIEDPAA